jgi:3-phytase
MHMPRFRPLTALPFLFLLAACAAPASRGANAPQPSPAVVAETYVSAETPDDELDSLATWRHPDGTTWLIATAKSGHRLVVFDADTGAHLRDVGSKGTEPGQFKRPNGIAVLGDRLFVVERDNHRVQVLALPDFRPLGSFGQGELRSPYGLWLNAASLPGNNGALDVYVTDNFMDGAHFDVVPPLEQLDQRVRRYQLRFSADGSFVAESLGSFGGTSEANALRIVESIAGDTSRDRLLIADEYQPKSTLREYTLAGRATGRQIPENTFSFEAEGVALWSCRRGKGYWVAVDQLSPLTIFHFFDRATLARIGSITGGTVAATDGISLLTASTKRFPNGALFAVHRDVSVAAFDLRDIAAALKLDRSCL